MKQTRMAMIRSLMKDPKAEWSWDGAAVIVDYLVEMHECNGCEIDYLDHEEVRSMFSEHYSARDAVADLGLLEDVAPVSEAEALKVLEERFIVWQLLSGGVVVID